MVALVRGGVDVNALEAFPTVSLYIDRRLLAYQRVDSGEFDFATQIPDEWQLAEGVHDLEVCLSATDTHDGAVGVHSAFVNHVDWQLSRPDPL